MKPLGYIHASDISLRLSDEPEQMGGLLVEVASEFGENDEAEFWQWLQASLDFAKSHTDSVPYWVDEALDKMEALSIAEMDRTDMEKDT